jgi:hypothetical protein
VFYYALLGANLIGLAESARRILINIGVTFDKENITKERGVAESKEEA